MPYNRIIFGLLAFFAMLIAMWAGLLLLAPVYLVLGLIAVQEYAMMMNLRGIPVRTRSLWVATLLTLPVALPPGVLPLPAGLAGSQGRLILLLGLLLYLLLLELSRPNRNSIHAVVFTLFGYLYVPFLLSFVLTLRFLPDEQMGHWNLLLALLAVIATDVGGYVFGGLFGRRRLAPAISPNKTLEGALGGVVLSLLVVIVTAVALTRWAGVSFGAGALVLLALLVAVAAETGDLFESLLKRWAGVKDTGLFLPGHGGVLDRIDSALFGLPVAYLLLQLAVLSQ